MTGGRPAGQVGRADWVVNDEDEGGKNMEVNGYDDQDEGELGNGEREPRYVVKSLTCIKNSYYCFLQPPS